ncbi:serine/threonine protein kinase [Candidatus Nitrospira allomarina]|uniref:Protein kinase n=1 Tax=Candidatus Nitrospira allomarina TaxID=3020900 RepID=A0AA96GDY0_9BACT|nr:protein kinase [Candidatus Nitrospira allomarina]WNM59856.1 protein kinase [Candidatus Nitrospira allomarina]
MTTQLLPGKIEIQGEIANGQTGTIYYGYDFELRQEMAIKVYHTHINGRLIRGKAFIEKAKSLLRLEHPNLIKIFKVEEQDGTPIVCMEFFDAPSLQHVIQNEGPLSVEKMLLLAREIAEVLVHIHFQGIIHGTLHPGHVLVGPQGQIKVMDLGLSWILMDILKNCDAELLRPLPYLLPETAKSELLTLGSDLYCLGFMMYDMLTTRVPYSGLPKTSIMGKLAFDQADPAFDFPDHVPKAICELIRQMTRNQSPQRLQDATHVLTILNQQLAKFAPEVLRPPAAPAEPHPTPDIQTAKIETPSLPPQAPVSVDPPSQPSTVTRPKHSTDYQGIHRAKTRKKTGVTIGITLLLFIGGTMGYIYKEQLGIPFLASNQPRVHKQPLLNEPTPVVPPIDSLSTVPPDSPISSPLNTSTTEVPHVNISDTPKSDNSNRAIPTPPAPATVGEDHSLKPDASHHPETPLPSPPEHTNTQSLNPSPQHISEGTQVSDKPNSAPSQGHANMADPPSSKKPVTPVTPPPSTTNPPATGQRLVPTVTEKPASQSEQSPALSPKGPPSLQDSTAPSPNTESLDNIESKELQDILDSVQIPTLSSEGPSPVLPSPPNPPSLTPAPKLPALSSPVSPP